MDNSLSENRPQTLEDWKKLDDEILIKAHLGGEAKAFEVLYRKHNRDVARLVYSVVKDDSLVDDVVQEVFLLVYRYLPKFQGRSSFKTWLYRISVNEALRQLAKGKRWVQAEPEEMERMEGPVHLVGAPGMTPERMVINGEKAQLVQASLEKISPKHRVILTLYYLEEMAVQEIAEVLDIPAGSVKSRLYYARESLKNAMDPFFETLNPGKDKSANGM